MYEFRGRLPLLRWCMATILAEYRNRILQMGRVDNLPAKTPDLSASASTCLNHALKLGKLVRLSEIKSIPYMHFSFVWRVLSIAVTVLLGVAVHANSPTIEEVSLPSSVLGNTFANPSIGTVRLSTANHGGVTIFLDCPEPGIAFLPDSTSSRTLFIPAGLSQGTFNFSAHQQYGNSIRTASVRATNSQNSVTSSIFILSTGLEGLVVPETVVAGNSYSADLVRVKLMNLNHNGTWVVLESPTQEVSFGEANVYTTNIYVPAGADQAVIPVSATPKFGTVTRSVPIRAILPGQSVDVDVEVQSTALQSMAVESPVIGNNFSAPSNAVLTLVNGNHHGVTVRLDSLAGDFFFTSSFLQEATITIPAGQTTANFTYVGRQAYGQPPFDPSIYARLGNNVITRSVRIRSTGLEGILAVSSIQWDNRGGPYYGTVSLTNLWHAGTEVTLSSQNNLIGFGPLEAPTMVVTVPADSYTASFSLSSVSPLISQPTTETIVASVPGQSVSRMINITP